MYFWSNECIWNIWQTDRLSRREVWVGDLSESSRSVLVCVFLNRLFLSQYHRSGSEGVLVDLSDTTPSSPGSTSSPDSELRLAMELSTRAQEEEERTRKEEEEELQRIIQLSLTEKWPSKMREGKKKGVPVIAITIKPFYLYPSSDSRSSVTQFHIRFAANISKFLLLYL